MSVGYGYPFIGLPANKSVLPLSTLIKCFISNTLAIYIDASKNGWLPFIKSSMSTLWVTTSTDRPSAKRTSQEWVRDLVEIKSLGIKWLMFVVRSLSRCKYSIFCRNRTPYRKKRDSRSSPEWQSAIPKYRGREWRRGDGGVTAEFSFQRARAAREGAVPSGMTASVWALVRPERD